MIRFTGFTIVILLALMAFAAASRASGQPLPSGKRAQPTPRPTHRPLRVIESVTVYAPAKFNSTPVSQRTYPREAYRDQGQPDSGSVLQQTPGALVYRPFDQNDAAPDVPIYPLVRGGLPYETAVGIDGARVSLPSTGTLDLSLIPTFVLQQVEMVRGTGDPAALGSGIDGAINLVTADPTLVRRGMLELEDDSRGGSFSDLAYDGTMPGEKFAFASMLSIDGSPGPLAGVALPGSPASDALRKALLVKFRYTPREDLSFTATVLATNLDRGLAGAYGALLGSSFVSLAPTLGAREDERLRFEQFLAQDQRGNDEFEFRAYALDVSNDGYSGAVDLANALDRERGAELMWTHASGPNEYGLSLDASGGDAYDDDASALAAFGEYLPAGSSDANIRARAFATLHFSQRSQLNLSAESLSEGTQIAAARIRNWSSFDAMAGFSQLLTPSLTLRASLGESSALPSLDMLATSFTPQYSLGLAPHFFSFNSSIAQPENAFGGDAGIEWRLHGDTTTLSFDMYATGTHDAFLLSTAQAPANFTVGTWLNGSPMQDEGLELSLVQFKPVGLGFIVQAALPRTYVDGTLPANVAGVPYLQGYSEISYKWPRGSRLSFGLLYSGANNPYGRPSFVTANTNLELSLGARSKFALSIINPFGTLDGRLPLAFAGVPAFLPNGIMIPTSANVLGPATIRVMFRQSFGQGSIYEH